MLEHTRPLLNEKMVGCCAVGYYKGMSVFIEKLRGSLKVGVAVMECR